jgi:transcriptional regulator of acetoin/glycerol metabolism
VRELRAAIERAALYSAGATVPLSALPPHVLEEPRTFWSGRPRPPSLREVEQAYIRHVLQQAGGSQTKAAAALGISRKALWEKRRRYGIP